MLLYTDDVVSRSVHACANSAVVVGTRSVATADAHRDGFHGTREACARYQQKSRALPGRRSAAFSRVPRRPGVPSGSRPHGTAPRECVVFSVRDGMKLHRMLCHTIATSRVGLI